MIALFSQSGIGKKSPKLTPRGNERVKNFSTAKSHLKRLYKPTVLESASIPLRTIYCDCPFVGKKVEHKSCKYVPKHPKTKKGKKNKRAYRVEWEHVVPAHTFGHTFEGWKNKQKYKECKKLSGRKCAARIHPQFRKKTTFIDYNK